MKTILLFIAAYLIISINPALTSEELENAIAKADFVGYGVILQEDNFSSIPKIKATEVLKGETMDFTAHRFDLKMNSNTEYLLIASVKNSDAIQFYYPVKRSDQLSGDELTILNNLPCYSEELKNSGIACLRLLQAGAEVCGCDNKEYYNTCEMHQHGILKFKPGKCKDH